MTRLPVLIGLAAYLAISVSSVAFATHTTLVASSSAIMILLGINAAGLICLSGLLLVRAPWSRLFLGFLIAVTALLSATGSSPLFWIGLAFGVLAIVGLAGPWLTLWVRQQPVANPLGRVPIALIASGAVLPVMLGFGASTGIGWPHWVTAAVGVYSSWAYGRGHAHGIWALRIAVPVTGLVTAFMTPTPGGYLIGVSVILIGVAAWTRAASRITAVITPPLRIQHSL